MFDRTPFELAVRDELAEARDNHPPLASLHEGYAVLLEEMDELKEEIWKKARKRDRLKLERECIQVAAMAARLCEDVIWKENK